MALIFWSSTDDFSAASTGSALDLLLGRLLTPEALAVIHFLARKAAHFFAYAVLALLLLRAFRGRKRERWRWRWAASSLLVLALYEYHQSRTARRTASVADSLLDIWGGASALAAARLWWAKEGSQFSRSMRSD
jgi:VanZ family protein